MLQKWSVKDLIIHGVWSSTLVSKLSNEWSDIRAFSENGRSALLWTQPVESTPAPSSADVQRLCERRLSHEVIWRGAEGPFQLSGRKYRKDGVTVPFLSPVLLRLSSWHCRRQPRDLSAAELAYTSRGCKIWSPMAFQRLETVHQSVRWLPKYVWWMASLKGVFWFIYCFHLHVHL